LSISQVGNLLRENRKMFLHKGCWAKFKGYSYSQMSKLDMKSHKNLEKLLKFEKENDISHKTSLKEIEQEIKNRGLRINKA
jgi:hypothetical protein